MGVDGRALFKLAFTVLSPSSDLSFLWRSKHALSLSHNQIKEMDVKAGVNIICFLNVLQVLFLSLISFVTASLSICFLYANGICYRIISDHRNLWTILTCVCFLCWGHIWKRQEIKCKLNRACNIAYSLVPDCKATRLKKTNKKKT